MVSCGTLNMGLQKTTHVKHSSLQQYMTYTVVSRLNAGEQIDVLFLDFSKAFDKVPHDQLIHKLHYYGILGSYLEWIKQFLVGRVQQVVIENKFVTEFWKISLMGAPETIRIFEFIAILLTSQNTFQIFLNFSL